MGPEQEDARKGLVAEGLSEVRKVEEDGGEFFERGFGVVEAGDRGPRQDGGIVGEACAEGADVIAKFGSVCV